MGRKPENIQQYDLTDDRDLTLDWDLYLEEIASSCRGIPELIDMVTSALQYICGARAAAMLILSRDGTATPECLPAALTGDYRTSTGTTKADPFVTQHPEMQQLIEDCLDTAKSTSVDHEGKRTTAIPILLEDARAAVFLLEDARAAEVEQLARIALQRMQRESLIIAHAQRAVLEAVAEPTGDLHARFASLLTSSFDALPRLTDTLRSAIATNQPIQPLCMELASLVQNILEKTTQVLGSKRRSRGKIQGKADERLQHLSDLAPPDVSGPIQALQATSMDQLTLLALISHEIRGPLTLMLGYSGMIEKTADRTLQDQFVQRIEQATTRIVTMVSELSLLFSEVPVELSEVLVSKTAWSVLNELEEKRDTLKADITVQVSSEEPSVLGNLTIIELTLRNLISNALKYGERVDEAGQLVSPPNIEVGCEENADQVRWYVQDHGNGINPDLANHLFMPFPADIKRRQDVGKDSIGLGLSIVKKMVVRMGGTIGFDHTPGGGSTFWFRLPRAHPKT